MGKLAFILSFFFICSSWAADSVRIHNVSDFEMLAYSSGKTYSLITDTVTNNATDEASAAGVYVGVKYYNPDDGAPTEEENQQYFLYSRDNKKIISAKVEDGTSDLAFPLVVTVNGGTAKYLHVAVKVGSEWRVAKVGSIFNNVTDQAVEFRVAPFTLCKTYPSGGVANPCNEATQFKIPLSTYFFVTQNLNAVGSTIDIADAANTGGVFFKINLSNTLHTSISIGTSNVRNGDERVILNYTVSGSVSPFSFIRVFSYSGAVGGDTTRLGDLTNIGAVLRNEEKPATPGELTINGLTNSSSYNFSLFLVDKYLYTSPLSALFAANPMDIQELLEKQACFLLTAGFGEEHYIINYFRHYMDHVLSSSLLGKWFIKVYYSSAPHYAEIIYKSPVLRFAVRCIAYILYFLFNYYWLLLAIFSSCYLLNLRKNKIFAANSSL